MQKKLILIASVIILLLFLTSFIQIKATTINLNYVDNVSTISNGVYLNRHVLRNNINGHLFIIHSKKVATVVYPFCARSTDNGLTWTDTQMVTYPYNSGYTSGAIDSNGYLYVAYQSPTASTPYCYNILFTKSTDDGLTWSSPTSLTAMDYDQLAPSICVDANDTLHVAWQGWDNSAFYRDIYYTNSTDHGTTWATNRKMTNSGGTGEGDANTPALTTDYSNRILMVFNQLRTPRTSTDVLIITSTNNGLTWSSPVNITNIPINANQGSASVTVLTDGSIHVTWQRNWGSNLYVGYSKSTNNGTTWTAPTNLTSAHVGLVEPYISSDLSNNIYINYGYYVVSPIRFQLRSINSTTKGASWGTISNLTTLGGIKKYWFNTLDQTFPADGRYSWCKPYKGFAGAFAQNDTGVPYYLYYSTSDNLIMRRNPTVTTNGTSGVYPTNATLHGYVSNNTGYDTVNCSFQYGYTTSYGNTTTPITHSSIGSFSNNTNLRITNDKQTSVGATGFMVFDLLWQAQTFTPTTSYRMAGAILPLSHWTPLPNDYYIIHLRKTSGGIPTGNDITYGIFHANNTPTVPAGYSWINVTFIDSYNVTAGTTYALILSSPYNDVTHNLIWQSNTANVYANGMRHYSADYGDTWTSVSTMDNGFIILETALIPGRIYHYRAVAQNYNGTSYGNDETFFTPPCSPTNFNAQANSTSLIYLTWVKGEGANYTRIQRKTGSYPTSISDGTNIYNGTGTQVESTGLSAGVGYYYKAWSYATWDANSSWSLTNATVLSVSIPEAPTNTLKPTTTGALVNFTWTKGSGADKTIIIMKSSSYPTSVSDGSIEYNGTGTYCLLTHTWNQFYRAWSYSNETTIASISLNSSKFPYLLVYPNASGIQGGLYDVRPNTATLKCYIQTNTTTTARLKYGLTTAYGTNSTNHTVTTTGNVFIGITGLTPGTLYRYRVYANTTTATNEYINDDRAVLTRPRAPTTANYTFVNATHVNLTWTNGAGRNTTVLVMSNNHQPTTPSDGTIVYNGTGTYYMATITPGIPYYHTAFSFSTWTYYSPPKTISIFNMTGLNLTWSYIGVNCFNESNPSQALIFNVMFKNEDGTHVFTAYNVSNTYLLNISNIPTGEEILIKVWKTGYRERFIYQTVTPSMYLNVSFYIPPIETEQGQTGDCVTKTALNSINVTYTGTDVTISFSHIPTDIISVERYNSSIDRTRVSYIDTASISSYYYTHDLYLALTHTLASLISVEVYNKSAGSGYGAWLPVPTNNYTYISSNNTIKILHYCFNANILYARVTYYYWEPGTYGAWQYIAENYYSWNSTTLTINKSALDDYTTMARVTYNWQDCPGVPTETTLYYIRVVETIKTEFQEFDRPVEGAHVNIQAYINTSGIYLNVTTLISDSNGYVSCWLIPGTLYQIIGTKTGYDRYRAEYQPPPPNQYGQVPDKVIRLVRTAPTIPAGTNEELMDGITWSVEPKWWRQTGAFPVWFNITSSDCKLEWFRIDIYHYNYSSNSWAYYGTDNDSTPCGGSVSYIIPNITGKWTVEAWFKKTNFSAYEVTQEGSFTFTISYLQKWLQDIPDYAYYIVVLIIMLIVMGYCMMSLGTGLLTGYIGLGVMALAFLLHPVTLEVTRTYSVSGWAIWGMTFIIYSIGLFIYSRI